MEILEKIKRFLKNFLKNFWKSLTRLKGQKKRERCLCTLLRGDILLAQTREFLNVLPALIAEGILYPSDAHCTPGCLFADVALHILPSFYAA